MTLSGTVAFGSAIEQRGLDVRPALSRGRGPISFRDAAPVRGPTLFAVGETADFGIPSALIVRVNGGHQTAGCFDQSGRGRDDDRNSKIKAFGRAVSPSFDA